MHRCQVGDRRSASTGRGARRGQSLHLDADVAQFAKCRPRRVRDDDRLARPRFQHTALSAFIWPYVNIATKTNLNTTAFLYLPSGSYDRSSAINLGANRWGGDIQLGLMQGIGERFAFDAEFDARFNGDNGSYILGNRRLSQDPTYRVQLWANWRWSAAFTTSIGYEGLFGGLQQVNGVFDGNKTEE